MTFDVFSRFRCCVYNGTEPLFVHVSVKFQLKETNVSAIVISGHVFSMFPLTYSTEWVMEPAEKQETVPETEVYVSETC